MKKKQDNTTANTCLLAGAGIGALGVAGAVTAGAVCPMCVIAAPALIGAGVVQRVLNLKKSSQGDLITDTDPGESDE